PEGKVDNRRAASIEEHRPSAQIGQQRDSPARHHKSRDCVQHRDVRLWCRLSIPEVSQVDMIHENLESCRVTFEGRSVDRGVLRTPPCRGTHPVRTASARKLRAEVAACQDHTHRALSSVKHILLAPRRTTMAAQCPVCRYPGLVDPPFAPDGGASY